MLRKLGYVYVNERKARGEFTQGTADRVWYCLVEFARCFGDRPLTQLGPKHVERWLGSHPEWRPGTRATHFGQMRAFCRWLRDSGAVAKDPFRGLQTPRRPRKSPRPLTRAQYEQLLVVLPDPRARFIVACMYWLGLRCCEVSRLNVEDIDRHAKVMVVTGKGGHERRLPLMPQVEVALNGHLRAAKVGSGPLVMSYTTHRRLQPATISILVRRWLDDAGLKQHAFDGITGHAMRHSALTDLAEATHDPYLVMELAGHSDISTSMHYVKRAQTSKLRDALTLREPIASDGAA